MARVAKFAERTGGGADGGTRTCGLCVAGQRSNPLSYGRTPVIVHRRIEVAAWLRHRRVTSVSMGRWGHAGWPARNPLTATLPLQCGGGVEGREDVQCRLAAVAVSGGTGAAPPLSLRDISPRAAGGERSRASATPNPPSFLRRQESRRSVGVKGIPDVRRRPIGRGAPGALVGRRVDRGSSHGWAVAWIPAFAGMTDRAPTAPTELILTTGVLSLRDIPPGGAGGEGILLVPSVPRSPRDRAPQRGRQRSAGRMSRRGITRVVGGWCRRRDSNPHELKLTTP